MKQNTRRKQLEKVEFYCSHIYEWSPPDLLPSIYHTPHDLVLDLSLKSLSHFVRIKSMICVNVNAMGNLAFSNYSTNPVFSLGPSYRWAESISWNLVCLCVCLCVHHHSNFSTDDPFKSLPMLHKPTKLLYGGCVVVSGACLVVSDGVWCMSGSVYWCQCL